MQNVQVLLQPTEIATQAEYGDSRRAGSIEGNCSSDSANSTWARCCTRARSSRTGSEPMLWVPNTTSTHGARSVITAWSFCARQPPTAICMPGWLFFTGSRWPRLPYSRLSAFSRTAQVLNTTTSGSAPVSALR